VAHRRRGRGLARRLVVFDDGDHHDLGEIKGNRGNQNYELPDGLDLDRFRSVSLWCDRFDVSFGAAELA
jgi:hypothetical protein